MIDVTFIKNTSRYGLFRYVDATSIANIYISSVKFDRCVSTEKAMVTIEKPTFYFAELTHGEYLELNKDVNNLRVENLTITECYSGMNFINITNILHTTVDGLSFENSADDNEDIDDLVNEFTLNDFKNLEVMGMEKGNIYQYKMKSIGFISMNYIDTVSITNSLFSKNRWKTNSLLNIKNAGYVKIQNTTFKDNNISSDEGGVINLSMIGNQGILIDNCTFYNITNLSSATVINISSSTNAKVTKSSFKNITTTSNSSVLITGVEEAKIDSCSFNSLHSEYGKSAGISFEGCNQVAIYNSTFAKINNLSGASAIYIKHSIQANISTSTFRDSEGRNFGTILTDEIENLRIYGCTFTYVKSKALHGGAIYMHFMKLKNPNHSLLIQNSIFSECLSELGSGCVYITSVEENLNITINIFNVGFMNCRAETGSAIYINNLVKIHRSNIQNITISSNINTISGPIHSMHSAGTLNLTDCIFSKNKGNVAGISALFLEPGNLLSLENIKVLDSECIIAGIYLQSLSNSTEVTTKSLYIANNSCPGLHFNSISVIDDHAKIEDNLTGIRLENKARLKMFNAQIIKNSSDKKGGGVYLQSYSNFNCIECIISENSAFIGAGIMVDQEASVILNRTEVSNNYANFSGSAIYLIECSSTTSYIEDCDILNNKSDSDGSIMGIVSNISIKNSRIKRNVSNKSTPGIVLNYSTLTLYNTTMQNHTAVAGSFIYAQTSSTVIVENSEFSFGYAKQNGGAVAILKSYANIISSVFKNLYSEGNSAAILASERSEVSIKYSNFSDLESVSGGSAVYTYDSSVTIFYSIFDKFKNSGVYGAKLRYLGVFKSIFKEGTGYYGGAIACIQCTHIELKDSTFLYNSATYSGGALYLQLNSYLEDNSYLISSCEFVGNHAKLGGALYSDRGIMRIAHSNFYGNKAYIEGGAAYLRCTDLNSCEIKIESTEIENNNAIVAGGGICWNDRKPILYSNNKICNNAAKYGVDIASYPIKIQYLLDREILDYSNNTALDKPLAYTLNNVAPGQLLEEQIQLALVDQYRQIVTSDSASYAEISPNNIIIGTTKVVADEGVYNFDNIIILTKPGSSTYLLITTSAVNTQKKEQAGDEESYYPSVFIQVNTRECEVGESDLGNECKICDKGTYSIDPEELCQECPVEAECLGGSRMYPKKHYWRSDMYTDIFFECLYHDACLGSPNHESYTGECEEGYRGNLCQACENGYSRRSKNVCAECPSKAMNRLITSSVSIGIVVYCIIAVKTSIISSYKPKSLQAMYIKIFINYWQLVGITIGLDIPWPESLLKFFSNNVNSSSYSFDCLLETSDPDSYIQVYYKKIVMNAFLPLIAIVVCMLVWIIISFRKNDSKYLRIELVATIVIILFFLHPIVTEVLLSIYSCRELEGEGFYLNANLDIECWKGDHLYYALVVVLPSVIIWAVGVPFGILMYLSRRKRHLKEIEMKLRFGYLYNGYKLRNYYWQFLILFRNVLVIMIIVFLSRFDVNVQALACLLVLILSYYFHVTIYPYKHKKLNELDRLGILIATITIYFGLYFMTDDIKEYSKIGLCVVILAFNCYFILIWLSHFGYSLFTNLGKRLFFLRSRFDKDDGFTHEYYTCPHLSKNVYIEEDQAIFTLITLKDPERESPALSIPNDMVDLYKSQLINDSSTEFVESPLSDENYYKDRILSSSRSQFASECETLLDSSFIQDSRIN